MNLLAGHASFKATADTVNVFSDGLMPIDPAASYLASYQAKSTTHVAGSHAYLGVAPYDVDNNAIFASHVMWIAGTLTTLAADLRVNDTTVQLTSAANWLNSGPYYVRKLSVWNYIDGKGKHWGPSTYTRNYVNDCWQAGGISGNTITLTTPWAGFGGGTIPAGTPVSNGSDGWTFMYACASNVDIPAAWTLYQAVIAGGYDPTGTSASNQWRPGTTQVKMLLLLNRDVPGNVTNFTDVVLQALQGPGLPILSRSGAIQLRGIKNKPF